MSGSSPEAILYDSGGNLLAVQNATAIPASTPGLIFMGSDGTNSRYITVDSSGRTVLVGAGVAGTPAGGVISIQGVAGGTNLPITIATPDTTATGSLGALNATVPITLAGTSGVAMQLVAGTLVGTIVPEISFDGGTTWVATFFDDPSTGNKAGSIVFASNNTATTRVLVSADGASNMRVRVSAFTSGTATCNLRGSSQNEPSMLHTGTAGGVLPPTIAQIGGTDGSNLRAMSTDSSGHPVMVGSGTAGTPSGGVLSIQGVSGGQTVPVSGTVTANQGGAPWLENITQFGGVNISTGTGASGTGIPRVTVANDSNILATQSGTWTVQPGNTANTTPWLATINQGGNSAVVKAASTAAAAADPALVVSLSPNSPIPGIADVSSSGALGALNATVSVTYPGLQSVGFQLAAGTLAATLVAEVSFDGGTTWNATYFKRSSDDTKYSSIGLINPNSAQAYTIMGAGGAGQTRVRVSTYTSGTANATLRASNINDIQPLYSSSVGGVAPPSIVQIGGANAGVSTAAVMKSSSTAAAATDASLVVGLSPNSPLPTGSNVIGAVTQSAGPWTVNNIQINGNAIATLAAGEQKVAVEGLAVAGAATSGNPIFIGGTDGTNLRAFMTDTLGTGITADIAYAAAIARISGAIADFRYGFSAGAGTPQPLRATTYTEQGSAALRSLSSSSARDTGAGTGAQQVTITGYDNALTTLLTEVVTLNGTTAVATVNSYRFIEKLEVTRVGSGGSNVGTITLFVNNAGGGGTIGTIGVANRAAGVGDNQTFWAHHYVRSGKTMYWTGIANSHTGVTSGVTLGKIINPTSTTASELQRGPVLGARQKDITYTFRVPVVIAGPARFTLYNTATGGNEVDGSFEFMEF